MRSDLCGNFKGVTPSHSKMKRYILFTLLLASYTSLAQSYTYIPFPQDSGVWWQRMPSSFGDPPSDMFYGYSDSNGVMVKHDRYYQFGNFNATPTEYWQVGKKIYGTVPYGYPSGASISQGDTLLYFDFGLTLGDTFSGYNFRYHRFETMTVVFDDSVGIQYGRRTLTLNTDITAQTKWVEGVGTLDSHSDCFSPIQQMYVSPLGFILPQPSLHCQYSDSSLFGCYQWNVSDGSEESKANRAWPNPFRDEIHILFNRNINGELIIYNSQGVLVHHHQVHPNSKELQVQGLGDLPSGTYFVVVTSDDGSDVIRARVVK